MNRTEYRQARRLIRDNGTAAYRWLGAVGEALRNLANEQDWLRERAGIVAWCKREGCACNPRQTSRLTRRAA